MSEKQRDAQYKMAKEAQDIFRDCVTFAMGGKVDELKAVITGFLRANKDVTKEEVISGFQSEGRTLLHVGSSSGHEHIIDFLLSELGGEKNKGTLKTLINTPDDLGFTPLINAVIGENDAIISKLIALGGDVNKLNKDNAGAVHFAAASASVARLRLLVSAGADASVPSFHGGSPLHWASGKGRSDAITYLLSLREQHNINIDSVSGTGVPAVVMAAGASCDAGVAALVEAGADTGAILSSNLTVLHICAENNLLRAARAILQTPTGQRCALLETEDGNKPVHLAAMVDNREMVELLAPVSDVGGMSTEALIADGITRMAQWHEKHRGDAPRQQQQSASASSGRKDSQTGILSKQPPRSTRKLEPVTPSATSEAAAEANACKDRGNELFKQKVYPAALDEYTRAIELQGDDATFWSNRSACFLAMNDAPNALLDAEVCRRLRPDWTKGCYRLAAARLELGMYEDAAVAAFEGLKLDNSSLPLKTLTQTAVKRGQEEYQKQKQQQQKQEQ